MTQNISTYTMSGVDESASFLGGLSTTENNIFTNCAVTTEKMTPIVSSTTFADIPGLSVPVVAGGVYEISGRIPVSCTVNSGAKIALGGTATLTSLDIVGTSYNGSTVNARAGTNDTTLGTLIVGATAVTKDITFTGAFVANTPGTITIQFAQDTSSLDETTALALSTLSVFRAA